MLFQNAFAEGPSLIVGYIDDSRFHPLIAIDENEISKAVSNKLVLMGELFNTFEQHEQIIKLNKQTDYFDLYTRRLERCGIVGFEYSMRNFFFTLNSIKKSSHLPRSQHLNEIISWYIYFSKDSWGKNFIRPEWLEKDVTAIADKSGVQIHYITDLNKNSNVELWITYELMYNKIGRMIYEKSKQLGQWIEIANHCFNCD